MGNAVSATVPISTGAFQVLYRIDLGELLVALLLLLLILTMVIRWIWDALRG
ncbi:MAG: hypothetical protein K6T57_15650 [Thermaceae bacterium]|nr:hypothetical protein [Thermaceae bacterium]